MNANVLQQPPNVLLGLGILSGKQACSLPQMRWEQPLIEHSLPDFLDLLNERTMSTPKEKLYLSVQG